jgi:threonine/homoserine/homoserine lactone efflux protein
MTGGGHKMHQENDSLRAIYGRWANDDGLVVVCLLLVALVAGLVRYPVITLITVFFLGLFYLLYRVWRFCRKDRGEAWQPSGKESTAGADRRFLIRACLLVVITVLPLWVWALLSEPNPDLAPWAMLYLAVMYAVDKYILQA